MRFVYPAARLLALLSAFVAPALAAAPVLSVTNYQFVGEERISRTESYVTYRADLINLGAARAAVTASLTSLSPNVRAVPGQGNLNFAPVPANGRVTSSNTFTIYVNRIVEFDFAVLQWTFLVPVANAGPNQTAKVGATVVLTGSASSNPSGVGTLSYGWIFMSRPPGSSSALLNANSVSPTFVPDTPGDYTLRLTVDNGAGTDSATVTVSTINSAPVANAGPNQTVALFAMVTLNGSGSSDVDGDPLAYSWTLIARPAGSGAVLLGPNTVSPTFAADKAGNYVAQLTVNDGHGNSAPATVSITTLNTPPVANAGPSQTVNMNALVQLNGAGSTDVDGDALTYTWSLITTPTGSTATLSSTTIVNPTFAADKQGTFVAQLIVNDGKINSSAATVTITTNAPLPPTANAGPNQTVSHGNTVTLSGSGSDLQGLSLTYQWSLTTKPQGSTATLSSATIIHPTFVADKPGTYVAQLLVSNGATNSAPSTVTITTTNTAPVANAGPNQTTTVGSVVTLDGTGSSDADHDPLTYSWSFTTKPPGSSAIIMPANGTSPTFLVDLPGTFVAQLIVNDGFASSNPATVSISSGSSIITLTPNPLNLATFGTGTLTITLGTVAPAGGLLVSLAITDTSLASLPANVLVPAGSTTANVQVTPLGGTGGASILAGANGFNPGIATVIVSVPSISITLDATTVGLTRTMNGTVTLSAPAPVGGTSVNLTSTPGGIVTLPASVNVAGGVSTATFTVTGAAVGSSNIVGSAPGYTSGSAPVNVGALGAITLQSGITVGPNQSVPFPVSLVSGAPAGGVTITLVSSDPTRVTVSPSTVFIAAFTTAPVTQPQVTGVNLGSASISASAPGFNGESKTVTVGATLAFAPPTLTVGTNATQSLTLTLSSPAPAGGLTINLSSSNPSAASVPATVNFAASATSASVPVTGGGSPATAVIHASLLPVLADTTANITVVSLGTITVPPNIGLGLGQSIGLAITLSSPAPSGGVTLSLVSSDPSKVSVSPASVLIGAGLTSPATQPQLNGLSIGTANITVSGAGYLPGVAQAQVAIALSFSPTTLTMNALSTQNIALNLSSPAPAGGLTVNLSSSNTAAVTVPATATFAANSTSVNVPLSAVGGGSSTIHASAQNIADTTASITVQAAGTIGLPASTTLGLGQSAMLAVTLSTPAPAGGLTITLLSSDTSKVTIAPATVSIAAGQTTPATQPQVTGVNLGAATITASAAGYNSGSASVQVSATVSFAPPSLTITGIITQNLTLNLSAPAPAGGVTINLSSSNTGVASVPATVSIAASSTSATVPVTAVALGSAVVHASALPNIADATANITVQSAGNIVLPATTNLGLGQSAALAVTLSAPAPAGGITVTLLSSNSSRVTLTPGTVAIAAGQTTPAVQPQVNGINLGAANITASAPGFASATGAVQVTASVSFSPQSLTVAPGDTQSLTLTLSGPAPAGGLTVNLSSSNTSAATVPASATFAAGGTTVNVPVTGVAEGTSTIHASALPGIADATANVAVQSGIILPANVTVPLGETVPFALHLANPAPAGGLFISLASSDTSKVTVSPANILIPEGQTVPAFTPRLTGVAFGIANITATAFGFPTASQQVQVGASLNFFPASLTIAGIGTQNISLSVSAPAPAGGMVIGLSSSNPGVASVPASVTIPASATSVSVPVTGNSVGTATLTTSSGLANVANATASVTVTSPGAISLPPNLTLGLGQTAAFPISLGTPAPVGGVTVTLVSSDPAKMSLSPTSVFIAHGAITPAAQPQVSGLDVGAVTVTASAPGYGSASATVRVTATMVFSPQNLFITGNGNTQTLSLALSAAAPLSGLQVFLSSSDTSVATVPGTFTFYPDGSAFTTLVIPVTSVGSGTAVIRATSSQFVPDATANVTVAGPGAIVLPSNVLVGPNQSVTFAVNLGTPAPAGGVTVTLNSSDASKVTVSPLSVTIAAGQSAPATQPHVTGGNLGSASISASAPGYTPATVTVRVGASINFSPSTVNITGGSPENVTLNLSSPAPPSGLTINLSSSDTNVATVPSTVTFAANATSVQVTITPGSLGSATIHASALPDISDATATVSVQSPSGIGLPPNTTVNLGQSVSLAVTLPSPAPPSGVTVNLSSNDTSKVTISPSTVTINAGQTTPSTQPQVTGVNFGAASITASAPGYISGVASVRVTATLTFAPSDLTIGVGVTQALTLNLSTPAPAGGLTIDLSSSETGVATVPFIVTFAANATSVSVPVTGVAAGSTVIHASALPNIADATANVNVGTPGTLILPSATTLSLGQTAAYAVSLPTPAPAGGATIALSSSNTSRVTIAPLTVTIAAGQTTPSTQPQITGVNLGNVMISASASGYNPASAPVRVSASINFSPDTLTISGSVAQSLTLTLSSPAPAGGLTINFSSSNTSVATVASSATLPANATSLNVLVTPVAPGSTVLTASAGAPNIADATANITVASAGTINLPLGITGNLGQSSSFVLSLSAPAPGGGVSVSLSSSDTGKATVSPATVSIPAGQTSPATQPQVTGVSLGSATITAAAAGYASATTLVQIGASAVFTPPTMSIVGATTQNASLSLSAPAPASGVSMHLSSTNTGVANVPSVVFFNPGDTVVSVPVTSSSTGSTVIHAFGTNIPDTTLNVTVTPATLGAITISDANVGQNLQKAISISIPNAAPPGGVTVVLNSSDPSRLVLAGRPGDAGGASLTLKISQGLSGLSGIYLQGLTLSGSATVTASADGYTSGVATITLSPSGFILIGPNGLGAASFASSQGVSTSLTIAAARLDAGMNYVETQMVRGGFTADVGITSSDTSVGTLIGTPINFTGGMDSATTQFNAKNPGTASVTASVPSGYSQPGQAANVLTASVTSAALIAPNISVGRNLENSANITLNGAAPGGGLLITLMSNDPSKMLLSNTPTATGSSSITLQVQGGSSNSLDFWVRGLASSGSVTYTASAPGFGSNTGTVSLFPSGIVIAGPFGFGNPLLTTNHAEPSDVTVSTAMLDGSGNFVQGQLLAGGASVSVGVTSSNTTVGDITTSPITITGGSLSATTQFQPHTAGNSLLTASVPSGFTAPSQYGSVTATVSIPGIAVTDGVAVGQKLQQIGTAVLGETAPAGGLSLTLTSNNPAALLISASPTTAGSASITITVPAGQSSANYYLQAVGSSGTPTYTATALGYSSRTGGVPLTLSGVVISGPFGLGLPFLFANLSSSGTTPIYVSMAQLDSSNHYVSTQQLAGGQSLSIVLGNTHPEIGTVTSPVSITGGSDTVVSPFTAVSQGTTTITVTAPAGFTNPASNTSVNAQVNP